jgi:hypothetical protein
MVFRQVVALPEVLADENRTLQLLQDPTRVTSQATYLIAETTSIDTIEAAYLSFQKLIRARPGCDEALREFSKRRLIDALEVHAGIARAPSFSRASRTVPAGKLM